MQSGLKQVLDVPGDFAPLHLWPQNIDVGEGTSGTSLGRPWRQTGSGVGPKILSK